MKMRYLLVGLVLLLLLPFSVSAERTLPLVVDRADVLSEFEERELADRLDRLSAELRCEIAVVTVSSLGGKKAEAFADDFFDENGYGCGAEDDGVLLLIAMTEREWHITTHGSARAALSSGGFDGLEDRMTPSLSAGQYDKAFKTFALGCEYYLRYERDPSSVSEDSVWRSYLKDAPRPGVLLLIAAALGIVCSFLIVNGMKSKLTSVRSRDDANDYVRAGSFSLTKSRDIFLYHTVSRVRRDSDRSSGGSHRSTSGRSHGGRGGRF